MKYNKESKHLSCLGNHTMNSKKEQQILCSVFCQKEAFWPHGKSMRQGKKTRDQEPQLVFKEAIIN